MLGGAQVRGTGGERGAAQRRGRAAAWCFMLGASTFLLAPASAAAARPGRQLGRVAVVLFPPCEDQDERGAYRLPVCSPACVQSLRQWRFWFSNYNVDESYGGGEHQGIGLFGYEYRYDTRFRRGDSVARPPWNPAVAADADVTFAARMQRPEASGPSRDLHDSALCEAPRPLLERLIYNHGRTLAARPSGSWHEDLFTSGIVVEVASDGVITAGPQPAAVLADADSSVAKAAAAIQRCLEGITDGFCDSVCGNCSYVLPASPAIGFEVSDVRGQARQFRREEGESGEFQIRYVRTDPASGEWPWVADTALGSAVTLRDPFTHCLPPSGRQALATLLVMATSDGLQRGRVITGLFGHNSNADAEAEYQAFQACRKNGSDREAFLAACAVCGTRQRARDGGEVQWPCLDRTNTAASKWSRYDGHHNVDDSSLGCTNASGNPCGNPNPVCRGNGQTIFGM